LIRQELGEERVECETVDSYQGQENHIIILSLGLAVCREEALYSFYKLLILWTITCRCFGTPARKKDELLMLACEKILISKCL
jgi:hypothetical protein